MPIFSGEKLGYCWDGFFQSPESLADERLVPNPLGVNEEFQSASSLLRMHLIFDAEDISVRLHNLR